MGSPRRPTTGRTQAALAEVEASIATAWDAERERHPDETAEATARRIVDRPNDHEWRLVDAATDHLTCPECGSAMGRGPRDCSDCRQADGFRFAAREPARPGVPPGNEHALRVSTAVLRAPHRWPASAVRGNELFMPLFLAGQMPTRRQQEQFQAAARHGLPDAVELEKATTFEELVRLATRTSSPAAARGRRRP